MNKVIFEPVTDEPDFCSKKVVKKYAWLPVKCQWSGGQIRKVWLEEYWELYEYKAVNHMDWGLIRKTNRMANGYQGAWSLVGRFAGWMPKETLMNLTTEYDELHHRYI